METIADFEGDQRLTKGDYTLYDSILKGIKVKNIDGICHYLCPYSNKYKKGTKQDIPLLRYQRIIESINYNDGDPIILPYSFTDHKINFKSGGQIKRNTNFGNEIFKLTFNKDYKNFLDIGPCCGLGTTKCFLDAIIIRNDNSCLYSVETNKNFYTITKRYWDKYFFYYNIDPSKFKLSYGGLVKYDDLDDNLITDDGKTKETFDYNIDLKKAPFLKLNTKIDVLCLDGGSFSTILEWELFKDEIKVVVLDDTNTLKTKSIKKEIIESGKWKIVYESNGDVNNDGRENNGELIAIKNIE